MGARRTVAIALLGGVVAVACSDVGGFAEQPEGGSLAALAIIDTNTDHREDADAPFAPAVQQQPLEVGDGVRTDETGFAEVAYADGSVTRLDAQTLFEVRELAGTSTLPEIEVSLDTGRTWNRVKSVTGTEGRFEVETSVGIATVRGTAFEVDCPVFGDCTFTVYEGIVVVTLLDGTEVEIRAGESVRFAPPGTNPGDPPVGVAGGGAGGPGPDGDGPDGDGPVEAVEVSRTEFDPGVVPEGDEVDAPERSGTDGVGAFVSRNLPLDGRTNRFAGNRESCSVTVDGRNLAFHTSSDNPLELDVSDEALVEAVATADIDTYRVDVVVEPVRWTAVEGTVEPDANGNRSRFAGTLNVSEWADQGVGLYRIDATTTGVRCDLTAFVRITGPNPVTTTAGIAGLLLLVAGTAGVISGATRIGSIATQYGINLSLTGTATTTSTTSTISGASAATGSSTTSTSTTSSSTTSTSSTDTTSGTFTAPTSSWWKFWS